MNEILWRGMTRAELDTAYDNRGAVKNSAATLATWTERSGRLRAAHPELLDLSYGARSRNRIDLFRAGAGAAPLLVFIHGGYWQRNAKELFACMAEGPLARGIDVALPGYTLAPEATMSEIVAEVRAAIAWLRVHGPQHGVAKGRLIVSGWSAGGHLTAMVMAMPEVDAGLAISGIYDLEPCRLNNLNEALRMSAEEAAAMSPLRHMPRRAGPFVIAYGAAELPELQRQSRDYWAALRDAGLSAELMPLAGHDHFSILEELASSAGRLTDAVVQLASR
jgi:arylformamidase